MGWTLCLVVPATLSGGCEVGSKSVGMETEGTGDGTADGVDDGVDDGQTSSPTDPSVGEDGSSGDAGTTGDDGTDGSTGGGCGEPPPIDLADCVACDPVSGAWTNDACLTDCTGQTCGEPCLACPGDEPGCLESQYAGACDSVGQCAVPSGPDQCMNALQPGFESELTVQGGCSDLWVFAHDPQDTLGLILSVQDGLVADAVASGSPTSTDLDITDPSVSFQVQTGTSVTSLECTDVIIMEPVIDETWSATAGALTIDLEPDGNGNAIADITLTDVTIERTAPAGGAAPIEIPTYVFTDVVVGWLPG